MVNPSLIMLKSETEKAALPYDMDLTDHLHDHLKQSDSTGSVSHALDRAPIGDSWHGAHPDATRGAEDESEFKNSLTASVERSSYVLLIKTTNHCSYCTVLRTNLDEFKSIFPGNVNIKYIVLDEIHSTDRTGYFMNTKKGSHVPSMFLMMSVTWDKYMDGSLEDKDLSIDRVASYIGIPIPFVYKNLRQWLSNAMHRLHIYNSNTEVDLGDAMILSDMNFPLVKFPLSIAEKAELESSKIKKQRHGKAFYVSNKCFSRKCSETTE